MLKKLFRLFRKRKTEDILKQEMDIILLKLEMIDTLIALKKETANTQAVIDFLDKLNEFSVKY